MTSEDSFAAVPTLRPNTFFIKKSRKNVSKPDATGDIIHAIPISPNTLKLIFLAPLYRPIPRIQPTITCELETGTIGIGGRPALINRLDNPVDEKMNKTSAWARTTTSAASEESSRMLLPIVFITLYEYVRIPVAQARPPSRNSC
jgi:hypothetical protein